MHYFTTNKILLPLVVFCLLFGSIIYGLAQPVSTSAGDSIIITVTPGMTANDIGNLLYEKGLVKSILYFRVIAKIEGMENTLQAGDYTFTKNMPVRQIVQMLATGQTAYRLITIPEGYTVDQIAALIEQAGLGSADKFKAAARSYAPYQYMAANKDTVYVTEGFLFPDTYRIPYKATEDQIVAMMVAEFDAQFTPELRERAQQLGMSVRDVITLASLVEKEAQLPQDRPVIAGVFLNRLKQGMPLQSCATIQYIWGYPKAELSVKDTELPSPYNTYQHQGLPPGPIANPGMASIQAALNPDNTDYLYFVADKYGAHHFSKTYEEHLATIEQVRN